MANISGNHYYNKIISGTSDADSINLEEGSKITVTAADGDDTITNGRSVLVYELNVVIDAGNGNDSILNSGDNVVIDGGSGYDTVSNSGEKVSINGGADNDLITNGGARASINAGTGNDSVYNYGSKITVVGGTGDDLISLASYSQNNLIQYTTGDGNDSIIGFNETDTLSITGGYSTTKSG